MIEYLEVQQGKNEMSHNEVTALHPKKIAVEIALIFGSKPPPVLYVGAKPA